MGRIQTNFKERKITPRNESFAVSRVISKVVKIFQLELPLKALFESPTVAEMALFIELYQSRKAGQEDRDRMLSELER
jgi:hypothetical protein